MDNLHIYKHLFHSVSSLPQAFSVGMFGMSSMDSVIQEDAMHLH